MPLNFKLCIHDFLSVFCYQVQSVTVYHPSPPPPVDCYRDHCKHTVLLIIYLHLLTSYVYTSYFDVGVS
jgi:hypothetical protein